MLHHRPVWPNDGALGEAAACCVVCDDSLTYLSVGCALSSPIKLPDGEGCLGPCVVVGRLFAGEATTVCLLEAQQPPCGVRMPLGVQGSGCCRTGPPGQLVVGCWALVVRLQVASTCRSKLNCCSVLVLSCVEKQISSAGLAVASSAV